MDLRKLKTLIDLVSESGVAELEIREGEDHVRIVNRADAVKTAAAPAPVVVTDPLPVPVATAAAEPAPAPHSSCGRRAGSAGRFRRGWQSEFFRT